MRPAPLETLKYMFIFELLYTALVCLISITVLFSLIVLVDRLLLSFKASNSIFTSQLCTSCFKRALLIQRSLNDVAIQLLKCLNVLTLIWCDCAAELSAESQDGSIASYG